MKKAAKHGNRHVSVVSMAAFFALVAAMSACRTTRDLENDVNEAVTEETAARSEEEEEQLNDAELRGIRVEAELKVQDLEDTVVFVDRPVYVPAEPDSPETERGAVTGYDAVVESQKRATVQPEQYKQGTFFYHYNENLVYEVYAQPYHFTDIILERGEVVTATPLLSEDESAWELTAGVAKDAQTGEDVQHLFIKPAYTKLDSSLVIITDRRVYHFRIKSYNTTYMAMVRFTYPGTKNQWARKDGSASRTVEDDFVRVTNAELLSFDYKMKYSMWKKPEFLPKRVYDDGQATYIQVDDIVLQKKLPVIFNERNEIVNYSVKKNVFVIPRLVNRVTLRLGKEKVTVIKKKTGAKKAAALLAAEEDGAYAE